MIRPMNEAKATQIVAQPTFSMAIRGMSRRRVIAWRNCFHRVGCVVLTAGATTSDSGLALGLTLHLLPQLGQVKLPPLVVRLRCRSGVISIRQPQAQTRAMLHLLSFSWRWFHMVGEKVVGTVLSSGKRWNDCHSSRRPARSAMLKVACSRTVLDTISSASNPNDRL